MLTIAIDTVSRCLTRVPREVSIIRYEKWVRRELRERKVKLMSTYPLSDVTPRILKVLSYLIFPTAWEMVIILSHYTDEETEG